MPGREASKEEGLKVPAYKENLFIAKKGGKKDE